MLVLPPGELDEIYMPIGSIMWKDDVIHKTKSKYIALLSEDWAVATSDIYRKFGETWTYGFGYMQIDRQTYRRSFLHYCRQRSSLL